VLGVPIGLTPFVEVRPSLKKLDLVGKGTERERRPTFEEMDKIVEMANNARKSAYFREGFVPSDKLFVYQMFSGRRIS
jgi:hypothetical protein